MNEKTQKWFELIILIPEDRSENAVATIYDFKPNGIKEDVDEDGRVKLSAYFSFDDAPDNMLQDIRDALPDAQISIRSTEWNPDDDTWRQFFSPFEIVPGIVVSPSWERFHPSSSQKLLNLDPGMAFGTGLHPTTKMCAQAIYQFHKQHTTLLDVGCGSGILSMVARLIGIEEITGVEIDEVAITVAKENFAKNDMSDISIFTSLVELRETYSMVVANILLNTLMDLRDELIAATSPGGYIILSGVTDGQLPELIEAYSSSAKHIETLAEGEWRCVVMRR